jgi:hypothetical protein
LTSGFPQEEAAFHRARRLLSRWGVAILNELQRGERG